MAFTSQTLTFIYVFVIFFLALSCHSAPSPFSSPSSSPSSSPTPTPPPSDEPPADTPISLSELFELSLPEIGVQKTTVPSNTVGFKLASTQLQAVEHKINEFKMVLKNRLQDPKTSNVVKKCLQQCQGNFEDAIDGVKTSIKSIDKHDVPKANAEVSAVSTDVDTCNECFIEMTGEDPEIKAFDDWVKGITGDCLVNIQRG